MRTELAPDAPTAARSATLRYLTRVQLRREVPAAAVRALLAPSTADGQAGAGHRLVWTLFADAPDRRRDFLWRGADAGVFYVLSERLPHDIHGLFEVGVSKPFAPVLHAGTRLHFSLRVNATTSWCETEGKRGKRVDVVMHALYGKPPAERASVRSDIAAHAATSWLTRQGLRHGFALSEMGDASGRAVDDWESDDGPVPPVRVLSYRNVRIDRSAGRKRMEIGVLDLEGTLVVLDPDRFVSAVGQGYGCAKAFGYGLMLIRRA